MEGAATTSGATGSGSKAWNARNAAVRRILQEIKEMQEDASPDFIAEALDEDIFQWLFAVRGPPDTEFEGGIYVGRILLPPEYPFKPPSFMMLTPSGRFQTGVKICLSISSHHPEHWQPSWSVRTALTALIAFMPTPGQGALGSIDFTKEERQQLAVKSRLEPPKFGGAACQQVIDGLHARMLAMAAAPRSSSSSRGGAGAAESGEDAEAGAGVEGVQGAGADAAMAGEEAVVGAAPEAQLPDAPATRSRDAGAALPTVQEPAKQPTQQQHDDDSKAQPAQLASLQQSHAQAPAVQLPYQLHAPPQQQLQQQQQRTLGFLQPQQLHAAGGSPPGVSPPASVAEVPGDRGLAFLALVLTVAIAAILFKKISTAWGYQITGVMLS